MIKRVWFGRVDWFWGPGFGRSIEGGSLAILAIVSTLSQRDGRWRSSLNPVQIRNLIRAHWPLVAFPGQDFFGGKPFKSILLWRYFHHIWILLTKARNIDNSFINILQHSSWQTVKMLLIIRYFRCCPRIWNSLSQKLTWSTKAHHRMRLSKNTETL